MSYDPKISYPIGGKNVQGGLPTAILNTLQFNAVTNQWEFVAAAGGGVSEVEFLQGKSAAGDMSNLTATLDDATGAIITVTPPIGTTTVIFRVEVFYVTDATGKAELRLTVDGVEVERLGVNLGGLGGQDRLPIKFITKGLQMIGNGVRTIVIEVVSFTATSRMRANMELYDL